MDNREITATLLRRYVCHLREEERADSTIEKYVRDLEALGRHLAGRPVTKAALIGWKEELAQRHAPATVNSMIAAVNGFLRFMGWRECAVKLLNIQKSPFCDEGRELTRSEYVRLVRAAELDGNRRLALVLQTICATGIRVSELKFIPVEAVQTGRAEIANKGKRRTVFLPDKLRRLLRTYLQAQKKTAQPADAKNPVFTTRTGKPLDRSNIWRDMKRLCDSAGVEPGKVFPHNLRHLFARAFYQASRDVVKLADVLGHSSIETTRIYLLSTGAEHARQLARLGLIS